MSKTERKLIEDLKGHLQSLSGIVDELHVDSGYLQKANSPEAYRQWYNKNLKLINLEGLVTKSLELIENYHTRKKAPWWKRLFR